MIYNKWYNYTKKNSPKNDQFPISSCTNVAKHGSRINSGIVNCIVRLLKIERSIPGSICHGLVVFEEWYNLIMFRTAQA